MAGQPKPDLTVRAQACFGGRKELQDAIITQLDTMTLRVCGAQREAAHCTTHYKGA